MNWGSKWACREFFDLGGSWGLEGGMGEGGFWVCWCVFTAIIGTAGYLPTTGERRVEINLCDDAGGSRC